MDTRHENSRQSTTVRPDSLPKKADALVVTVGAEVCIQTSSRDAILLSGRAAIIIAMIGLEDCADRRRLATLLWPDSPESQARNNLRTLLHRVTQRVGQELLGGSASLRMRSGRLQLLTEAEEVVSKLAGAGPRACELLADAGVDADAGSGLSDWLMLARRRLRKLQLRNICDALTQAQSHTEDERAVAFARACVQLEPLSEHWHRQLMNMLALSGDRNGALAVYEDLKRVLREQLGVLPDTQTRTVQLRILQGQADGGSDGGALAATSVATSTTAVTDGLTPLGGAARYPLVERAAILDELRSSLNVRVHIALQGEAGVGKTRLLGHLAASQEGFELVATDPSFHGEAYAAIAQVLQQVQPRRAARVGLSDQVELARIAPLAFPGVPPSETRMSAQRLHVAFSNWLQALADAGVQCLVIDDLHYADQPSQAAIAAWLSGRRPERCPAVVLAYRTGEIGISLAEALAAGQARGHTSCFTLPRLTLAGVRSLLEAIGVDPRQAEPHFRRTGGNPLFVIELAQHQADRDGGNVPQSLNGLLASRLRACTPAAQQLSAVAAIAGKDFSVEIASRITGKAPLALMPAWRELQQRGLFADHGPAHDLITETLLDAIPPAIGRTLSAQLAATLEDQGLRGAPVLRHWVAAHLHDQALPHAVHHLHVTSAAGLSTLQLELDLLDLLTKVGDEVLCANLWLTAEVGSSLTAHFALGDVWPRLGHLVARVKALPNSQDNAAWIAYEAARQAYHVDRAVVVAYDLLRKSAASLPDKGVERARVEQEAAFCARIIHGDGREHARNARRALTGLPGHLYLRRVQQAVDHLEAADLSAAELIIRKAPLMRAARLRGDLASAFEARVQIALANAHSGSDGRAWRHFEMAMRATKTATGEAGGGIENLAMLGIVALKSGRFDTALRCFEECKDADFLDERPGFLALTWLRLGDFERAQVLASQVKPSLIQRGFLALVISAYVQAELDDLLGANPVPALQRTLDFMASLGMDGVNLGLMAWEITLRSKPAEQRWIEGTLLLDGLRMQAASSSRVLRLMIGVAEAGRTIGQPLWLEHATMAARMLRRGCASCNLYVPDGFLRCATMLAEVDPLESLSLMHVARRWIGTALAHVPEASRDRFLALPVNRLLLERSDDKTVEPQSGDAWLSASSVRRYAV